jgi:hypothetical protein
MKLRIFNKKLGAASQLILKNCEEKWGDEKEYLEYLLQRVSVISIFLSGEQVIAFCLSKLVVLQDKILVAFLATRVMSKFQSQGLAKRMIRSIAMRSVVSKKIFSIKNLFKPVYFVTATANPIVVESIIKNLPSAICVDNHIPAKDELDVAHEFAILLDKEIEYDKCIIIKNLFLHSAEDYSKKLMPQCKIERINSFLNRQLKFSEGTGDGIVIVGKIC